MRRLIGTAPLFALVASSFGLVSGAALAQEEPASGWIEIQPTEEPGSDLRSEEPAASPEPGMEEVPPPDTRFRPPTEPTNPDWYEEGEPPVMAQGKRQAVEFIPRRYAARPLVLPRGMIRGTADFVIGDRASEPPGTDPFGPVGTIATINFGASVGLAENFEIGASRYRAGSFPDMNLFPFFGFGGQGLLSLVVAPDVEFGDIPVYARFQPLHTGTVQLAFDAVFRIPSNTRFGFLGSMPLRFSMADHNVALDTGVEFTANDNPNGRTLWSLNFPVNLVGNLTPSVFLKLHTGMHILDLTDVVGTATSGLTEGPFYIIPVGFGGGYSMEARRALLDLFIVFRWPTLYGFDSDQSEVTTDVWAITVGVNVHSPPVF